MTTTKDKDNRSSKSRESKATYQPPQRLEIPPDVVDRFAQQGYALRWIRVRLGNQEDVSHVAKRKREGYIFVKPEEAQDLIEFLGLLTNNADSMVMNGDLGLCKILFEKQEARQNYYNNQAIQNEKGLMHDLENNHKHRSVEIFNDSRSSARTGRRRTED